MINDKHLHQKVGAEIKTIRKSKHLSQQQLSEKVGLQRSSIANIENGRQSISLVVLFKIAAALDKQATIFLPNTEEVLSYKVNSNNDDTDIGKKTSDVLNMLEKGEDLRDE